MTRGCCSGDTDQLAETGDSPPINCPQSLLLFGVGLLVPGTPGFQLHLPAPQEPSDTLGASITHSPLQEEPMSLRDSVAISPLFIASSSSENASSVTTSLPL